MSDVVGQGRVCGGDDQLKHGCVLHRLNGKRLLNIRRRQVGVVFFVHLACHFAAELVGLEDLDIGIDHLHSVVHFAGLAGAGHLTGAVSDFVGRIHRCSQELHTGGVGQGGEFGGINPGQKRSDEHKQDQQLPLA